MHTKTVQRLESLRAFYSHVTQGKSPKLTNLIQQPSISRCTSRLQQQQQTKRSASTGPGNAELHPATWPKMVRAAFMSLVWGLWVQGLGFSSICVVSHLTERLELFVAGLRVSAPGL